MLVGLATIMAAALLAASALAAGDANEPECPAATESSPGFRSYLADCRAYELVTPPFQDGTPVRGVAAVSSDGSRVIVSSFGAFAGTEGDPIDKTKGAVYELARSGSGWGAYPLTPPATLSPNAALFDVSADATRSLWQVLGSSKSVYSVDLDLREAGGSFVKVGPLLPPAGSGGPPAGRTGGEIQRVSFAGASKDLSHVVFKIAAVIPEDLWPGDTTTPETTARSLYEYVGTGNTQPMLVGICTSRTGGSCPNGEGHLISDCETALGSASEFSPDDAYNAISASGETVFFTAMGLNACPEAVPAPEVSELYARLGQLQTVPISEPSSSQCGQCATATKRPAVFQGASEDGSKAFFLTEQELFEGDTTMNLYEYDFDNPAGQKIVRVSDGSATPEVQGVARVSEDGSHVYFVAKGVLAGANAEGGSPTLGANNLYVFERDATYPHGRTTFIATLSSETEAELTAHEEPCLSLSGEEKEQCEEPFIREFNRRNNADSGDWQSSDLRRVQATPDGRFLVFDSAADLTAGDASTKSQVFEYDAAQEKLVRISIGANGYAAGGANAELYSSSVLSQNFSDAGPTQAATKLTISADGSRVLFRSPGALTEGAEAAQVAGVESLYEYRSVGSIANGNVYLVSDASTASSAEPIGLDASGQDAFFSTVDSLVPADVNTQLDIYDARGDGGFPAPVAPVVCAGEACQGSPRVTPVFGVPGSVSESGGGNLVTPVDTTPTPKPKSKPKAKPKPKPKHRAKKRAKKKKASVHGKSNVYVKGQR